jgi:hypothetical protein
LRGKSILQMRYKLTNSYRYDALATRAALSTDADFRWCLRSGCGSGQIHLAGEEGPIFSCISCKFKACITHEREWHEGETCEQYDDRIRGQEARRDEEATARTIERTTKKCPQCQSSIEKNSGCDHMTCKCLLVGVTNGGTPGHSAYVVILQTGRRCSHEFCWACCAPYGPIRDDGNHMHRRNCIYHG